MGTKVKWKVGDEAIVRIPMARTTCIRYPGMRSSVPAERAVSNSLRAAQTLAGDALADGHPGQLSVGRATAQALAARGRRTAHVAGSTRAAQQPIDLRPPRALDCSQ